MEVDSPTVERQQSACATLKAKLLDLQKKRIGSSGSGGNGGGGFVTGTGSVVRGEVNSNGTIPDSVVNINMVPESNANSSGSGNDYDNLRPNKPNKNAKKNNNTAFIAGMLQNSTTISSGLQINPINHNLPIVTTNPPDYSSTRQIITSAALVKPKIELQHGRENSESRVRRGGKEIKETSGKHIKKKSTSVNVALTGKTSRTTIKVGKHFKSSKMKEVLMGVHDHDPVKRARTNSNVKPERSEKDKVKNTTRSNKIASTSAATSASTTTTTTTGQSDFVSGNIRNMGKKTSKKQTIPSVGAIGVIIDDPSVVKYKQ